MKHLGIYKHNNKGLSSQGYGFSSGHVWMWELDNKESWALKNWCFWAVVLEKTLESPLTESRSNQSILKGINPEYSLEGLMLKLKLQYFGYLMKRTDLLEKTLMLERLKVGWEGDDRGWDGWMASPARWTWVWWTLGFGDGQGGLACFSPWGLKELDMTEWLTWTELKDRKSVV